MSAVVVEDKPLLNAGNVFAQTLEDKKTIVMSQKPKLGCLEFILGCDFANRFHWKDNFESEAPLYVMKERSSFCVRLCCGPASPFEMILMPAEATDYKGETLLTWRRPLASSNTVGCCPCFGWCNIAACCFGLQRLEILDKSGTE